VGEVEKGIYFDLKPSAGFELEDGDAGQASASIRRLMNLQRMLMHECGVFELPPDIALLVTATALHGETFELVKFFGDLTKPWKRQKEIYLPDVKEEAIDCLFFVLQAFVLLGMDSEEVMRTYEKKHSVNFHRIQAKLGETNV